MIKPFEFAQEQLPRLAASSIELGERSFVRQSHLRDIGFVRHDWYANRARTLCTGQEWQLSRTIELEEAKEIAGNYGPYVLPIHGPSSGFESPILKHLRAVRDTSGRDREWFSQGGPDQWRYYLGPASQRLQETFLSSDEPARRFKGTLSTGLRHALLTESKNLEARYDCVKFEQAIAEDKLLRLGSLFAANAKLIDYLQERFAFFGLNMLPHGSTRWRSWIKQLASDLQIRVVVGASNGEVAWHVIVCSAHLPKIPDGDIGRLFRSERVFEFRLVDSTSGAGVYKRYSTQAELAASVLAFLEITHFELPAIQSIVTAVLTQ